MKPGWGLTALGTGVVISLFPQSAADPLMVVPFVILSAALLISGKLLNLNRNDPILLLLTLLWFLWTLSAIRSPVPFPSKVTWVILGTLPLSYMAWTSLSLSAATWNKLTAITSYAWSILGLIALYQVTPLPLSPHLDRAAWPFEDANMLGTLLALGLCLCLPHLLQSPQKFLVPFLAIGLGLITTQSRSAILGAVLGLSIYALKAKPAFRLTRKTILAFLALTGTSLTAIWAIGFQNRIFPLSHLITDKDILARLALWQSGWDMLKQSPIGGIGLGTFHLQYPPHRQLADISAGWWVHMDTLQTAIESGIAAALVIYAIAAVATWKLWKAKVPGNASPTDQSAISAIAAALASFFITLHTAYPLHVVPLMICVTGCLSRLSASDCPSPALTTAPSRPRAQMVFALSIMATILCALISTIGTTNTLLLWRQVDQSAHLQDDPRFRTAMAACLNDGDPYFPDCRLMAARRLTNAQTPLSPKIPVLLSQAEAANPFSPAPPYLEARYLLKMLPETKAFPLVKTALEKSLDRDPAYWPARRLLVQILSAAQKDNDALTVLRKGGNYPLSPAEISAFHSTESQLLQRLNSGRPPLSKSEPSRR